MIFNRQSMSGDLSTTLIISGVLLTIGVTFLMFILPNLLTPSTELRLGDGIFRATIVSNDVDRAKGLSGIKELAVDQAILMAFPTESEWEVSMNDTTIPIDIVWLDKNKKVIFIVKNISPKDSKGTTYNPKTSAKYIVQLPAGTVDSKSIKTNNVAIFQIEPKVIK